MGGTKIKVFDRDGHHRRMVLPFPAGIPYEKVKNMGVMRDDEGRLVPEVHSWAAMRLHPSVTGAGRGRAKRSSPTVDSKGTVHWMLSRGRLVSVKAEGGSPYKTFLSEPVFAGGVMPTIVDAKCKTSATLAVGEGDRYLYVSNLYKGSGGATKGNGKAKGKKRAGSATDSGAPLPCVYRLDLGTRGRAEPFAGNPGRAGKEGKLLTAPGGIACAGGIVYVADRGSDRVVGFNEKDGSVAGQVKIAKPSFLGVDPGSGAIYVSTFGGDLVKFDGLKGGKEVCRVKLPRSREPHRITVDASKKPVHIWMTIDAHRNNSLYCAADTGTKLVVSKDPVIKKDPFGMGGKQLSCDRPRGDLLLSVGGSYHRMNEDTGELEKITFAKVGNRFPVNVKACPDGSLVSLTGRQGLNRWTRDGKRLNWDGAGDNTGKHTGITSTPMVLGPVDNVDVFRKEIFVIPPGDWRALRGRGDGVGFYTSLNVHGMDGKIKRTAVWQCSIMAIPRLDARGNIYVADNAKPRGRLSPKFFDGKRDKSKVVKGYDVHNYMYGSIIKFPPEGGAIWFKKGVNRELNSKKVFTEGEVPKELMKKPEIPISYPAKHFKTQAEGTVQGAEWMRFGFAPYSCKWDSGKPMCSCDNASFDVDGFGRVFYPNLGQFRVEMVDTG
ncbi:MAG: PQQ-binding-like beta-propeller repeat protein, partial [Planctomycetota bacterium]